MSVIRRYVTSALGSVLYTVAGLSAIAFGCLLVAVAAFVAPSFVGGLGLNLLVSGGTVAENVSQLRAETFVSLRVLGAGLVVTGLAYVVGRRTGSRLYSAGGSTATQSPAEPPDAPYLRKFEQANLWAGLALAALLVTALLSQALVRGTESGVLAILAGLLQFALRLFGGPVVLALVTGAFLGVWYGLRESATEALVAGIVVWGLVGLAGLGTLLRSAAGFGLLIGGLQGVYYGVRAWGSTEPVTPLEEYVP